MAAVVYTSVACIASPFPEWIMSFNFNPVVQRFRPRWSIVLLSTVRVALFWTGGLVWHIGTERTVGIMLTLVSFVLLFASYLVVTSTSNEGKSWWQAVLLGVTLLVPDTNWLFDLGCSRAPGLRFSHAVVCCLNVCAALIGLYVWYVADELYKAYGCYPSHVSWVDYNYGLCPIHRLTCHIVRLS